MSLKNPVTTPGIDPGTVRLVAQRLNQYATAGPTIHTYVCVCVCVCVYIYICIYKTRLASKEIFSPSNKIHRDVGRAKDSSAPRYHMQYMELSEVHRCMIYRDIYVHGNWSNL